MIEIIRSQTLDNPQHAPTESFITRACRRSMSAALIALGVASTSCAPTVQRSTENPTTEEDGQSEEPYTAQTEVPDQPTTLPETEVPDQPTTLPETDTYETQEEDEEDSYEDKRTPWEKVVDKLKAKAFKAGVESKCEEKGRMLGATCSETATAAIDEVRKQCAGKTGILAKICSKTAAITTDKAKEQCEEKGEMLGETCSKAAMAAIDKTCQKVDKPTIEAVCENGITKNFCTGKSEQILGAFLAYCAEKRAEE